MKKRMLSVFSLMLTVAMLFSACGGAAPAPAAPAPAAPAPAAPAPVAPAKTEATLVYWTMWNETEPQGQVLAEAVEAYTKKTGVKVEVQFNGREIRKTLQPALDNNTAIDLFDEDVERVNGTWGKYLLNVEDMAAKTYDTTGGKPFTQAVSSTLIDLAR
ncbi:MAG: carbohydrate ABC transporter substrate-binding protein, partial [Angelakisella sp.]